MHFAKLYSKLFFFDGDELNAFERESKIEILNFDD